MRAAAHRAAACGEHVQRLTHAFTHLRSHRRLLPCKSTFNCVSTSSKNADQYTSPWTAPVSTPAAAGDAIIDAVRATCPGAELVSSEALPSGQYLRFHVPGALQLFAAALCWN